MLCHGYLQGMVVVPLPIGSPVLLAWSSVLAAPFLAGLAKYDLL